MRYGSMEEAAGQYLAKAVEYADIRIHEGISIENEVKKEILLSNGRIEFKFSFYFIKFKLAMAMIQELKNQSKELWKIPARQLIFDPFDESVAVEILIHAVRGGYIKKTVAGDFIAELNRPQMTIEFLNETKDIDGEESFEL